jgi:hypothetical protein
MFSVSVSVSGIHVYYGRSKLSVGVWVVRDSSSMKLTSNTTLDGCRCQFETKYWDRKYAIKLHHVLIRPQFEVLDPFEVVCVSCDDCLVIQESSSRDYTVLAVDPFSLEN